MLVKSLQVDKCSIFLNDLDKKITCYEVNDILYKKKNLLKNINNQEYTSLYRCHLYYVNFRWKLVSHSFLLMHSKNLPYRFYILLVY